MNNGMERQDNAVRAYQAPTLKVFGSVIELTASGTGRGTENRTGQGKCSPDGNKVPCRP